MPNSVLEAIKIGWWDFEPRKTDEQAFDATLAMPGTKKKIDVLADRVREGLPLWHSCDLQDYDDERLARNVELS